MTVRFWFLTNRTGRLRCYRCEAPATGYDSSCRPLCCPECVKLDGCRCYFRDIQKQVASEIPILKRATRNALAFRTDGRRKATALRARGADG